MMLASSEIVLVLPGSLSSSIIGGQARVLEPVQM